MSTIVTHSEFITIYDQYAQVSEAKINHFLARAETSYVPDSESWGFDEAKRLAKRREAIMLLTAHWIEAGWSQRAKTVSAAAASAQGKTSSSSNSTDDFASTDPGRQYLSLLKTLPEIGMIVT